MSVAVTCKDGLGGKTLQGSAQTHFAWGGNGEYCVYCGLCYCIQQHSLGTTTVMMKQEQVTRTKTLHWSRSCSALAKYWCSVVTGPPTSSSYVMAHEPASSSTSVTTADKECIAIRVMLRVMACEGREQHNTHSRHMVCRCKIS